MEYRHQLLTLAERYGGAANISASRVGSLIGLSGSFFDRIRGGASCNVDTYLRVKSWFVAHWPAGEPWPDGVDGLGVPPRLADNPAEGAASAADAA